jgi:hypothetical protein
MKMQDAARQHPPFDAPAGMVALLKSQGFHEINEIKVEPPITVNWAVQRGRFIGDFECPPLITFSASNGNRGYCESQVGTAHKSVRVLIPGQKPVTCPSDIAEAYLRLFAEWASKSKRKRAPAEQVSAATPKHILQAQADTLIKNGTWRRDVETRTK